MAGLNCGIPSKNGWDIIKNGCDASIIISDDYVIKAMNKYYYPKDNDVRIILFVILDSKFKLSEDLLKRMKLQIRKNASPRHVPNKIIEVNDIPRTKSGKIVELAVKNIIEGNKIKNKEALANPESLKQFVKIKELKY